MHQDARPTRNQPIDPDAVADIAREVLARLASTTAGDGAATIVDRVVSVDSLQQIPANPKQISIRSDAVVTPAAKDEARRRGIAFERNDDARGSQQFKSASGAITDTDQPDRAAAALRQLAVRGIELGSARVVLSDTPAREVWRHCSQHGERAVMITAAGDVQRFAVELEPTVWVLDMNRMNLIAAVNAIAAIPQTGPRSR